MQASIILAGYQASADWMYMHCSTLYDVFQNIREDEAEHVRVMTACRDYSIVDALAAQKEPDLAPGNLPRAGYTENAPMSS